jgi:SAM-dependent methyltransferase
MTAPLPPLDHALTARLDALCEAGWELFERFELEVRDKRFHPFVAADYALVRAALTTHRAPGRRFLELGSATGVIAIMADLLGYESYGIELDGSLVETARALAARFDSRATFVEGSFLPTGFAFTPRDREPWTSTTGIDESGYLRLGRALDDFDVVFGYPWGGERRMMRDLMKTYGDPDALLLLHDVDAGVEAFRGDRPV